MPKLREFLFGSPGRVQNVSTLRKDQEPLFDQLQAALQGKGAGGAYGDIADYYRGLLSDDSADYQAFSNPMLRQYNEEIVPGLSEQFAGMGSGGLSSSGFRNAQVQGATDLSERLGALRAQLRQRGVEGLQNLANTGLQSYSQPMQTQAGSEGLLSSLASGAGGALTSAFLGPLAGAAGEGALSWIKNSFGGNKVGANSSPYGNMAGKSALQGGMMGL